MSEFGDKITQLNQALDGNIREITDALGTLKTDEGELTELYFQRHEQAQGLMNSLNQQMSDTNERQKMLERRLEEMKREVEEESAKKTQVSHDVEAHLAQYRATTAQTETLVADIARLEKEHAELGQQVSARQQIAMLYNIYDQQRAASG